MFNLKIETRRTLESAVTDCWRIYDTFLFEIMTNHYILCKKIVGMQSLATYEKCYTKISFQLFTVFFYAFSILLEIFVWTLKHFWYSLLTCGVGSDCITIRNMLLF